MHIGILPAELQPQRSFIIRKEVFTLKGYHIAIGDTCITGEEKEIAGGFQLHLIRLKGQAFQLTQRSPIQCTRLFVLSSFNLYGSKQLSLRQSFTIRQTTDFLHRQSHLTIMTLRMSQLSDRVMLQALQKVFFNLTERISVVWCFSLIKALKYLRVA